jgi:predicted DNA-binding protein (UPF0251 family)
LDKSILEEIRDRIIRKMPVIYVDLSVIVSDNTVLKILELLKENGYSELESESPLLLKYTTLSVFNVVLGDGSLMVILAKDYLEAFRLCEYNQLKLNTKFKVILISDKMVNHYFCISCQKEVKMSAEKIIRHVCDECAERL